MASGEAPARQTILRFGEFELDLARQTLSRRGIRLKLQNQPCQVLALLIQRAPEVVSRDEIRQRVWGNDVYIDTEQSINFCIRQIRGMLLDNAASPRFIETLPREGYRFIAPLEGVVPRERLDRSSIPPAQEEIPPTRSRAWLIAAVAALVLAVGITSWLLSFREQGASAALHVVPATSYPGRETTPTLSPDGSQIAFSWDGENGNNLDIYVKLVGENRL
jgi:DNA-binding winged helix-turn-helix (wHTH) protein